MTPLQLTLANRYTQLTLQTLAKHAASPSGLDTQSALRLLRRNVRDAVPRATQHQQAATARAILAQFLEQMR